MSLLHQKYMPFTDKVSWNDRVFWCDKKRGRNCDIQVSRRHVLRKVVSVRKVYFQARHRRSTCSG